MICWLILKFPLSQLLTNTDKIILMFNIIHYYLFIIHTRPHTQPHCGNGQVDLAKCQTTSFHDIIPVLVSAPILVREKYSPDSLYIAFSSLVESESIRSAQLLPRAFASHGAAFQIWHDSVLFSYLKTLTMWLALLTWSMKQNHHNMSQWCQNPKYV